jgi:LmbE family N-acetylglucosaminyl deacetylase
MSTYSNRRTAHRDTRLIRERATVSARGTGARRPLRLLGIFAHPDDETLGFGGVLARYADEGVETHVVTATSGQRGWFGPPDDFPGEEALGLIRRRELGDATTILGVRSLTVLDYMDGELREARADEIIPRLAAEIRRVRPQVIVTFGHDGFYGHPDHIAISQFATAATLFAADATADVSGRPHRVDKVYYRAPSSSYMRLYEHAFGELVMEIDGEQRRSEGWAEWLITTRVDAREHWPRVWAAVQQHRSQLPAYERLAALPPTHHEAMWGTQEFYRGLSAVSAPVVEDDLFAGIRVVSDALMISA